LLRRYDTTDAEGTDFYYLGKVRSSNAEQTSMPGDEPGSQLSVVTMNLDLDSPVEVALYDYLTQAKSAPILPSATGGSTGDTNGPFDEDVLF